MPFEEAIKTATEVVQREQKERLPTPFDNSSSDEEEEVEDYRPKYKDVFGSFC